MKVYNGEYAHETRQREISETLSSSSRLDVIGMNRRDEKFLLLTRRGTRMYTTTSSPRETFHLRDGFSGVAREPLYVFDPGSGERGELSMTRDDLAEPRAGAKLVLLGQLTACNRRTAKMCVCHKRHYSLALSSSLSLLGDDIRHFGCYFRRRDQDARLAPGKVTARVPI